MAKRKKSKRLKKKLQRRILKFTIGLLTAILVALLAFVLKDMLPTDDNGGETTSGSTHQKPTGNGVDGPLADVPSVDEEGYLEVHYIDVGQGDSILVTCNGEYMLIDAGENGNGDTVIDYITDLGIDRLDLVIATHAHSDHIGSMDEVLNAISADEVWYPEYRHGTKTETNFLTAATNCGATIRQPALGEKYDLGGATVTVLGPVKCDYSTDDHYDDPNDMSIVVMVQYGDNKFLFTGDLEKTDKAETDMVDYWDADVLKADVLKVGHHGSDTSTSYYFLRTVDPTWAVISVGEGNKYNHPKQDTMDILGDAEVTVYRTDYMGSIVAVSDGTNIKFYQDSDSKAYIPD